MSVQEIIALVLVVLGLFFFFVGGVGIIRFPDFFTRLHPAGKADTLGAFLTLLGLCVYSGFTLLTAKLLLVQVFIFVANPSATHAIGRAALRSGLPIWEAKEQPRRTRAR